MLGHISTQGRNYLNSEAAGREVAHDWRDRKDEFVQKQKRHRNGYSIEIFSFYTISTILMMKVNLCDNQRPQLETRRREDSTDCMCNNCWSSIRDIRKNII